MKTISPPCTGSNEQAGEEYGQEGRYDVRRGAAAYAPIVGTFGALAVAAVPLVFTQFSRHTAPTTVTFATGMLIVGLLGSLTGAFCFAAIGAQRDPTANLAPAVMYGAVSTVVAVASILAAFEVLASVYVSEAKAMFEIIVASGGVYGCLMTSMVMTDLHTLGPRDRKLLGEWRAHQQWRPLKTRASADRWARNMSGVGALPILAALSFRFAGLNVQPTRASAYLAIGVGMFLALGGASLGAFRTVHKLNPKDQLGLRPGEAIATTLTIGFYVGLLLIVLP